MRADITDALIGTAGLVLIVLGATMIHHGLGIVALGAVCVSFALGRGR